MSARQKPPLPPVYLSGHCGTGHHDRCRGNYAGAPCRCDCHLEVLNALNTARLHVADVAADLAKARADLADQEVRYSHALAALHRAIDNTVYGPLWPAEPPAAVPGG